MFPSNPAMMPMGPSGGSPMGPPVAGSSPQSKGLGGMFGGDAVGRRGFKDFLSSTASRGGMMPGGAPGMMPSAPPGGMPMPVAPPMGGAPMMAPPVGGMGPMGPMGPQPMGMGPMGRPPMGAPMQPSPMQPRPMGFADGGAVPMRTEIRGMPHDLSYITADEAEILELLGGTGERGPGGVRAYPPVNEGGSTGTSDRGSFDDEDDYDYGGYDPIGSIEGGQFDSGGIDTSPSYDDPFSSDDNDDDRGRDYGGVSTYDPVGSTVGGQFDSGDDYNFGPVYSGGDGDGGVFSQPSVSAAISAGRDDRADIYDFGGDIYRDTDVGVSAPKAPSSGFAPESGIGLGPSSRPLEVARGVSPSADVDLGVSSPVLGSMAGDDLLDLLGDIDPVFAPGTQVAQNMLTQADADYLSGVTGRPYPSSAIGTPVNADEQRYLDKRDAAAQAAQARAAADPNWGKVLDLPEVDLSASGVRTLPSVDVDSLSTSLTNMPDEAMLPSGGMPSPVREYAYFPSAEKPEPAPERTYGVESQTYPSMMDTIFNIEEPREIGLGSFGSDTGREPLNAALAGDVSRALSPALSPGFYDSVPGPEEALLGRDQALYDASFQSPPPEVPRTDIAAVESLYSRPEDTGVFVARPNVDVTDDYRADRREIYSEPGLGDVELALKVARDHLSEYQTGGLEDYIADLEDSFLETRSDRRDFETIPPSPSVVTAPEVSAPYELPREVVAPGYPSATRPSRFDAPELPAAEDIGGGLVPGRTSAMSLGEFAGAPVRGPAFSSIDTIGYGALPADAEFLGLPPEPVPPAAESPASPEAPSESPFETFLDPMFQPPQYGQSSMPAPYESTATTEDRFSPITVDNNYGASPFDSVVTAPTEAEIEELEAQGMTRAEAIEALTRKETAFGQFAAGIGEFLGNALIPGLGTSGREAIQRATERRIEEMADIYMDGGSLVYNGNGQAVGVVGSDGVYTGFSHGTGFDADGNRLDDDIQDAIRDAAPPVFEDDGEDRDRDCPEGYTFDRFRRQCVPVEEAGDTGEGDGEGDGDGTGGGTVDEPYDYSLVPIEQPEFYTSLYDDVGIDYGPVVPFRSGGPVTPNVDRFMASFG